MFSSASLLAAEDRLLERSRTATGPTVPSATIRRITSRPDGQGRVLGDDQAAALAKVAASARQVDVLLGPAGAGKTTAMNALRRAWEAEHGHGSVVGLAPSAAAAQVLAEDLGIPAENTAKWWDTHERTGNSFRRDQLVILDEASLAGTLSLDRITNLAAGSGAKVLLVGDHAQLQSVDAGGAFAMLVHDRDEAAELVDIHRFANAWEKAATLELRRGRTEAIDTYIEHGRVLDGDTEAMTDAAYRAWRTDRLAGRATVLVADSTEAVAALNVRARTDLILDGIVHGPREVELYDGSRAAAGDSVITRRNDRRLRAGRGWVRNGDRWTVAGVHDDGSLTLRRTGNKPGASVVLPAAYAAEHLDLGYAVTSYRAQGMTTQTAHVLVEASMTRENLYVAMTRGRENNTAYVATDKPDAAHEGPHPYDSTELTARGVLYGVLQHVGAEPSAHEAIAAEQDAWGSIAQLAAEYETLAAAAQHDRWAALIRSSGLARERADDAVSSDAFGPLTAELRRAEANHHDVEALLPRLVHARGFEGADDIAAVLRHRLALATARPAGSGRTRKAPRLIAGLIPQAGGPMDDEMRRALDERGELIEARADAVLDAALDANAAWAAALGAPPQDRRGAGIWRQQARVVAAYRDRYAITADPPLGAPPGTAAQKADRARALAALDRVHALSISRDPRPGPTRRPSQEPTGLGL